MEEESPEAILKRMKEERKLEKEQKKAKKEAKKA